MTPKPICLIKVDRSNGRFIEISEMQQYFSTKMRDYYVLVVPFEQPEDEYDEPIRLQVFYEKDFTEAKYEELKKIVSDGVATTLTR